MFHFLTAHITFRNVFGRDRPVDGVTSSSDNSDKPKCVIDSSIFVVDPEYEKNNADFSSFTQMDMENDSNDEEDDFQK